VKKKWTKRSAEITVETDEFLFIKGDSKPALFRCPVCCREVLMIAPEYAARIARVSTRTIYAWVEAQKVHFAETPEGSLLICMESVVRLSAGQGE
jgi:hypothetical protein